MRALSTSARFETDVTWEVRVPDAPDGSVLVALHGMGQSAAQFADEALAVAPPATTLLVPEGPYPFEKRRPGAAGPPERGNAWYVWTGDSAAFTESMEHVGRWLLRTLEVQLDAVPRWVAARDGASRPGFALDAARVALLGYSQGGYLAGFVALRNPRSFRALVVAAGRLKDEVLADAAPAAAATGLRVLDVHGEHDEAVRPEPCRASAERLAALGVAVDFRTYPCGHRVLREPTAQADVRAFLAETLRAQG